MKYLIRHSKNLGFLGAGGSAVPTILPLAMLPANLLDSPYYESKWSTEIVVGGLGDIGPIFTTIAKAHEYITVGDQITSPDGSEYMGLVIAPDIDQAIDFRLHKSEDGSQTYQIRAKGPTVGGGPDDNYDFGISVIGTSPNNLQVVLRANPDYWNITKV